MLNVFIFSQRPNRSEMIGLHLSLTPALCSIVSHSAFTSGPAFIQPLRITHNYHVSMTQNTRMSSSCLFIASWWAVENEYDAIRANGFERSVLPGTVPNRHCYPPCPDGTHCVAYKPNLWILSSVISPKCFSTLKKIKDTGIQPIVLLHFRSFQYSGLLCTVLEVMNCFQLYLYVQKMFENFDEYRPRSEFDSLVLLPPFVSPFNTSFAFSSTLHSSLQISLLWTLTSTPLPVHSRAWRSPEVCSSPFSHRSHCLKL